MKHLKSYEALSRGKEIVYTFKEKAITVSGNNRYEYTVHLLQDNPKYDNTKGYSYNGLVISIDTTPGSWYVSTYLHYNPDNDSDWGSISGNEWLYSNRRNIKRELLEWIKNEYPYYQELKKYNL
jgi:hypothetical protein